MSSVGRSAREVLERWRAECRARPGALPADCEPVQTRLIRAVGRGHLPGHGEVFVKVMGFPRARDRVRYLARPLPSVHEARVLRALAARAPDVPCPDVVEAVAERRLRWPRLSMLVTAALPAGGAPPGPFAELARVAARLAAVGVFHPDLNRGNFLALPDGRTAVLDLQSARLRRGPVGRGERIEMAAKLWLECGAGADPAELATRGVVPEGALASVLARAEVLRFEAVRRRIARCFVESTEFRVARGVRGTTYERRDAQPPFASVEGGRELRRLWLGDRVLHVLHGREPVLAALFVNRWWLPGRSAVYIPGAEGRMTLSEHAASLSESAARWEGMLRSRRVEQESVPDSRGDASAASGSRCTETEQPPPRAR